MEMAISNCISLVFRDRFTSIALSKAGINDVEFHRIVISDKY